MKANQNNSGEGLSRSPNHLRRQAMRTGFGVRNHVYPNHYQFVAFTPSGHCYQIGFTDPVKPTLKDAVRLWKESRKEWEPDNSGGAGVQMLNPLIEASHLSNSESNTAQH